MAPTQALAVPVTLFTSTQLRTDIGDPVWSAQESEGHQTLRVSHVSVAHSYCLPRESWSSVVGVVTFTHLGLAASGSGTSSGLEAR